MKAITITKPFEIEVREIPMPEAKEGEALLQVLYCGICGADVASFTGNQPFTTYPRIPGHEFSARIVSAPEKGADPETIFISLNEGDELKSGVPFSLTIMSGAIFK